MTDAELLAGVEERVRRTICATYSSDGKRSIEGRISKDDLDALLSLMGRMKERYASLYESVNPASDEERLNNVPGAGAMGAVLEFRDLIRNN